MRSDGILHDPRSAAVGELDPLAVECAAARAEIRGRFALPGMADNRKDHQ